MKRQKDATFDAITSVVEPNAEGKYEPTKDERATIIDDLVAGFAKGQIEMGNPAILADAKKLKEYVSGLVSNWLRKDPRLNGGTKYVPTNPGSRVSDPMISNMRKLRTTLSDPMDIAVVDAQIAKRQAELNASKVPTIDVSALPESLRHLVKQSA